MENNKFQEIAEKLRLLNGVTKKSSEKILVDLIINKNKIKNLVESLNDIEDEFGICPICFYMTVDDICPICSDDSRNKDMICVVSSILDAMNIEQSNDYNGQYAVLEGEINLNKGISPDKLKINNIFSRTNDKTELILALDATYAGELTANYIRDLAKQNKISYSKLARGIPMGGTLDYMDSETLKDALNNRRKNE